MVELSGLEISALVKEIERGLAGSYVNRVYSFGPSQLIRFRKSGSEDIWLVVSSKKGVWPSKNASERTETDEFTTRLRGELERSRFLSARQADLDRVFEMEFEGKERRTLVVELMPPGNVLVTDASGKVRLALNEVRTTSRRVVRGAPYVPPVQTRQTPAGLTEEDVKSMVREEKTVGRALGRHVALPRKYVAECLSRLNLGENSPSSSLEGRETDVVRTLREMVAEARDRPRPCICETSKGDEIFAFAPVGLKVKESAGTLSELCDKLFLAEAQAEPATVSPAEAKRKEMEVTISRLNSEAASLRTEALNAREAADRARSSALKDAIRILEASGVKAKRAPSSPDSVASVLFDRAKELESKAAAALDSARRLERRMPKMEHKESPRRKLLPVRKVEWYEKFRWFFTSGGKLAVGGRDAQTNSTLISRHLEDHDTVYHADLFGSPFFVLKGGEQQSEEEVLEVAQATVAYSSAWKTGLGSADAYWVSPEQVKTAAPSGEYLQRGSFAITGKKNFVTKILIEVAVGTDHDGRVVAGPEAAVRTRSPFFLVLRPHKETGSDTAKRVLKDLSAEQEMGGRRPNLDEVLRMLPTGGGKVVRRGGGHPVE